MSELPFADIVDAAGDPIVVTAAPTQGHLPQVVYVNRAFELQSGCSRDDIVGRPHPTLGPGTDRPAVQRILRAMERKESVRTVLRKLSSDGAERWLQVSVSPLRDKEGEVTHFVAVERDLTDQKKLEARLMELASRDGLTGLYNQRAIHEQAKAAFERSVRYGRALSVAMIDLDHFKVVNDTWGHAIGNEVLKCISKVCTDVLRTSDVLGRVGGEEFTVLAPETGVAGASTLGVRLCNAVRSASVPGPEGPISVTTSIGISERSAADKDVMALFARADAALYRAKDAGRDRVVVD